MKDIVSTLEKKDLPELNKFDWQDPLLLDSKLSDSERLLVKSVREFAEKKLLPKVEPMGWGRPTDARSRVRSHPENRN